MQDSVHLAMCLKHKLCSFLLLIPTTYRKQEIFEKNVLVTNWQFARCLTANTGHVGTHVSSAVSPVPIASNTSCLSSLSRPYPHPDYQLSFTTELSTPSSVQPKTPYSIARLLNFQTGPFVFYPIMHLMLWRISM